MRAFNCPLIVFRRMEGIYPLTWLDLHLLQSNEICTCVFTHRFDADLNAAKDESSSEVQAKEKLAREKEQLQVDFAELKDKIKVRETEKKLTFLTFIRTYARV